jgi:transcriptional regulator with XRE-family HTH domain
MGYRGKVEEQERARVLRARNMTLQGIATALGVAKSSVSRWVRDVPFTPSKRRTEFGCAYVSYGCSRTHRQIMGLVRALLSSDAIPG